MATRNAQSSEEPRQAYLLYLMHRDCMAREARDAVEQQDKVGQGTSHSTIPSISSIDHSAAPTLADGDPAIKRAPPFKRIPPFKRTRPL
jgi:hypothetical protein